VAVAVLENQQMVRLLEVLEVVVLLALPERLAQQIQVAEGAVVVLVQEAMAVLALSFFATPAQFNISLVAQ
jgi:hypothetical protein